MGVGVTGIQLTEFSVPLIKYSFLPRQSFWVTFDGGNIPFEEELDKRFAIISCQIGAAPVIPEERTGLIGALSLFPTQTATT